ncbi:peptide ABC transporter substrate-binding protein [Desulfallas sp. Bu1-1]|uniref:peptide ABC transporter substrate-binding protein n=1 Tax=Desulfallas sp. Bu1-1 TaxID=2787620 RepID=UPI00189FB1BF|nr:peptide ABC transporter substrate-binding protein [Desulfallas sp. Bu1-1]MBF7082433.1 peptide ABC transporter substrate-binding protein [Desulfallas sp. Bu1-1]
MRRLLLLLAALSLLVILAAGCGGASQGKDTAQGELKFIRHNHGEEPESIDPALNTTVNGGTIIIACFEGLTSLNEKDEPVPGVAESWDISPDKTKYTFHLRKDAKWSDGKPVTAGDFAYAWKRALNPDTAAEYCYQLFYIKNAPEFNEGKAKAEDLGIKVVDDYTLEVELSAPTPYFLNLTAFPTLFPVRQDIIEQYGDQWTLKPETYIGNGPFKMTEWQSKDHMKFVKNENYWDKDRVKIDGIIETFIAEASTMLAGYEAGELDIIDDVPLNEIDNLKKTGEFHMFKQLGTYYYCFNVTKPPFDNPKVRKAFALAIDREDITTKVRKSGIPATAFVAPGVPDTAAGKDFREVGGAFFPVKAQPEEARRLLAEAGYPDGKGLPDVTLIYNNSEEHQIIAEAILEMWKKNLGIENVTVQNQEWAVFINTRQNGDFQIARHGWIGDYNDAMTFLDLFTTGNGNNDAHWSNKQYDELIKQARLSTDEKERMRTLHQAEKMIMEDAIMIPILHYTENCMIKPYVKGLVKSMLGFTYFDRAEIVK